MMDRKELTNAVKNRTNTIRLRTWTLTLAIFITLIFYFLVTITTKQKMNLIDFSLLCVVQIVVYFLYFPDGELFGQKNDTFINNRTNYNEKATKINQDKRIGELREYCKFEYEERKKRYILNECGFIGITEEEFNILKQKDDKEIKNLTSYEFKYEDGNKLIFFNKSKRKRLYKLIFCKIPVDENHPETIMSAVENNGNNAIKDGSISYRNKAYIRKFLIAVVIGGVFTYIGYTLRTGIGITEIVSILMYLTTLITTAVMSFTSGETCSKVYKNRFYVDLANYIDGFNEWADKNKPIQNQILEEKEQE